MKHPDTFQIVDEHVILVGCDDMEQLASQDRLHLPYTNIDTRSTQQMLDYFAVCLETNGPILVEQLFQMVSTRFPQEQWLRLFKTPSDLTTFLKMFSDCFHIQANLVTLLQKAKLSDLHIQNAQDQSREQYNAINNCRQMQQQISTKGTASTTSNSLSKTTSSNSNNNSQTMNSNTTVNNVEKILNNNGNNCNGNINECNNGNGVSSLTSLNFKLSAPVTTHNIAGQVNSGGNRSDPNSSEVDSYVSLWDTKLENLCEHNYPNLNAPLYLLHLNNTQQQQQHQQQQQQQQSSSLSPTPMAGERCNMRNQSLKQRINNLVIRTLAENYEKDKHSMANQQQYNNNNVTNSNNNYQQTNYLDNNGLCNGNSNNSNNNNNNSITTSHNSHFIGDTWKIKVLQNTNVVANVKQCQQLTQSIMNKIGQNNNQSIVISLECEGINIGSKGDISLISMATIGGDAFIFDVTICPDMINEGGLKTILEHENIIKIMHDCRNDSVNLYQQFGILLKNVFDTQV